MPLNLEEVPPPSPEVLLERVNRVAAAEAARVLRAARRKAINSRNDKLLIKLREGAYEGRRKAIELQRENEKKLWPMMWSRMSSGSQSRVREEEGFAIARSKLDCVRLWGFIRETHLTHVFGIGDPMKEVNAIEQEIRFAAMRQGDREFIACACLFYMDALNSAECASQKRFQEFCSSNNVTKIL